MSKSPVQDGSPPLFEDIKRLIDEARKQVAQTVNTGLTAAYWNIGKRIKDDILKNKRAEYGEQILPTLSAKLVREYGNGFSTRNLKRMIDLYLKFSDFQIVVSLMRQLSWSHFIEIIPLKTDLERAFYAQVCRVEKWSVRTLRKKKLTVCSLIGQPSAKNRTNSPNWNRQSISRSIGMNNLKRKEKCLITNKTSL